MGQRTAFPTPGQLPRIRSCQALPRISSPECTSSSLAHLISRSARLAEIPSWLLWRRKQLEANPGDRVASRSLVPKLRHLAGGSQQEEHNQCFSVARSARVQKEVVRDVHVPHVRNMTHQVLLSKTSDGGRNPGLVVAGWSGSECSNLIRASGRAGLDLAPQELPVAPIGTCLCASETSVESECCLTCPRFFPHCSLRSAAIGALSWSRKRVLRLTGMSFDPSDKTLAETTPLGLSFLLARRDAITGCGYFFLASCSDSFNTWPRSAWSSSTAVTCSESLAKVEEFLLHSGSPSTASSRQSSGSDCSGSFQKRFGRYKAF